MAEMNETSLGARVRETRERAGLTQGELGQLVGLERTAVNKIESGARRVTALELSSIAEALGVRMSTFFSDPVPALISYRARQGLDATNSRIDGLLADLATDVELIAGLAPQELPLLDGGAGPDQGSFRVPTSMAEADELAVQTRRRLQLDDKEPVRDLVAACGSLGLLVFGFDLGVDSADAGTLLLRRGGVSVVNSYARVGRRRLAAAHELGHYLVSDEYTVDWRVAEHRGDVESRLDRFARAVLLPADGLRTEWARHSASQEPREVAVLLGSLFRVDMATLARRLEDLGLIGGEEAAVVRAVRTTQADIVDFGLLVPTDLQGTSLPTLFKKAVLRAYRDERISQERTLELLRGTFLDDDLPPVRRRREDELWKFVS